LQLGAWVVAALFSLAGALTIAELGASFPQAGGLCVYLRRPSVRSGVSSTGGRCSSSSRPPQSPRSRSPSQATGGHFLPLSPRGAELVAVAAIAALTGVNVLGVREGVWTQNVVTFAKLAVISGLVVLAFAGSAGSTSNLISADGPDRRGRPRPSVDRPALRLRRLDHHSYIGGEVKQPGRNLPLAALISIAIVTVLYLALNAAYLFVLGSDQVAASPLVTRRYRAGAAGPARRRPRRPPWW